LDYTLLRFYHAEESLKDLCFTAFHWTLNSDHQLNLNTGKSYLSNAMQQILKITSSPSVRRPSSTKEKKGNPIGIFTPLEKSIQKDEMI
jgi:hypothetical protein